MLLATTLPSVAFACGGLFCNSAQPVNQAAERILFAFDEDGQRLHMHIRLTWQGPPTDFGWLLPVPPDVETGLSSELLFQQLEAQYAPRFSLITEYTEECEEEWEAWDAGAFAEQDASAPPGEDPAPPPRVQIISREAVGPYDRVILLAETVQDLFRWLDENDFQYPEGSEEKLQPYIEAGAAFVALKLLPTAGSNDVVPLRLTFGSPIASIPIVPTAVAANNDMGVIVHVLGDARAVPANYRHVQINQAAIDWVSGGSNYADVVSQAADEAEGQAFATDYAGPRIPMFIEPIPDGNVDAVRRAETWPDLVNAFVDLARRDIDLQRIFFTGVILPPDIDPQDFLRCPDCYPEPEVDGPALADRIESEINEPRRAIMTLLDQNPYMTRLFTTLSPAEMTVDPAFDFNRDLPEVGNDYRATRYVGCGDDGFYDWDNAIVETPDGLRFRLVNGQNPNAIQRQNGEVVRGEGVPAAAIIERLTAAGQPEPIEDNREDIGEDIQVTMAGDGSAGGCACDVGGNGAPLPVFAVGLLLLITRRRRR
ncbi:MAG: DUF2330 domain-containing protein [Myxococcales bacterium]|nr:DUF2330 domain-containing protein [Myxococcales bacterium]